jgi:hypothetical protein
MPDFSKMSTTPIAQQWSDFLKRLPEDRGCYEMTRVPMSAQSSHGPPSKDNLVQSELTCVNGADKRVKSFYKANTVMTANQHKKTVSLLDKTPHSSS